MGESKLPIYAFVDETGNTGHNLFDEVQPDFFTAALITKGDFDRTFATPVQALAKDVGVDSLHGKQLGMEGTEAIADGLLATLRASRADFFVSRVEKQYLLVTKLFDALCDSGENAAVAWHHYNIRPLRLMLTFKLATIVDLETAKLFWQCILEPNEKKAYDMLPVVCEGLQRNLDRLPDEKARQVLGQAFEWARTHSESIQIHTDRKTSRQGHFPNLVAFANLLDGLSNYSKTRRKRVARITHDRQSELEKTLSAWHDLYSNAPSEELHWAGETYSFQKVAGSEFEVKEDSSSPGIQITDVVLWLYSQLRKGKQISSKCTAVLEYVLSHGWESDFSFAGVDRSFGERFGAILSRDISAEQEQAARELLARAEKLRIASMVQYDCDGLPPFMRKAQPAIPPD